MLAEEMASDARVMSGEEKPEKKPTLEQENMAFAKLQSLFGVAGQGPREVYVPPDERVVKRGPRGR